MTTTYTNTHDLASVLRDPSQYIRLAVFASADGSETIELLMRPDSGSRLWVKRADATDAFPVWVANIDELMSRECAQLDVFATNPNDLYGRLFLAGWRVAEQTPYTGPLGMFEIRAALEREEGRQA